MTGIEQHGSGLDIVVFGGGGGGSVMVGGVVEAMPDAHITAIVPTGDSGSRTGDIRTVFGGPAIGDARKVLGAVAAPDARIFFSDDRGRFDDEATPDTVRELNEHFLGVIEKNGTATDGPAAILEDILEQIKALPGNEGKLRGHTYTNLVLNALRLHHKGGLNKAIAEMHQWVGAPDRVRILGITEEPHTVMMHDKVAKQVFVGEGAVDEHSPADPAQVDVWLESGDMTVNRTVTTQKGVAHRLARKEESRPPKASADAVGAIAMSNITLLAPGSLYTSIEPMLRSDGVSDGLLMQQGRQGLWVAVTNLTEEKKGLDLSTHLRVVRDASGREVTHFIHNTDIDSVSGGVPTTYDPDSFDKGDAVAVGRALVDQHEVNSSDKDPIAHLRSRHHHNVWQIVEAMRVEILPGVRASLQSAAAA